MALNNKFFGLLDVILRVPPLFVIDELLRTRLGLPQPDIYEDSEEYVEERVQDDETVFYQSQVFTAVVIILLKFCLSCLGCVSALCVFMLWTKHLVTVYMYLMSVGIVFVSYWTNVSTMKAVVWATNSSDDESSWIETHNSPLEDILSLNLGNLLDTDSFGSTIFQNYVLQCALAFTFCYVHLGPRYPLLQNMLPVSFMAPTFLALLPLPPSVIQHAPVFAALLPLALVKFVLWCSAINVVRTVYGAYQYARTFVSNFGLSTLVETEWARLNVPCVLRTFWILRVIEHAVVLMAKSDIAVVDAELAVGGPWAVAAAAKSLLISGCETTTAVLGMTSAVSYICHYVGCFFQWALQAEEDEEKSIGTVSAILFYILALQTGLTGLEPEKRFVRLCRNVCLLFTALLHFVHNIVNPLLMSLSASHNPSLRRHARALAVCAFLILFPSSLLVYLWSHHPSSTWLLAVSAFSVEVIVKVWVSLAIYSLFLVDACRSAFWERLDDYVYYIRAFGNTVEFCFGIFLFFNGAWILAFESGGTIRAIMMCIHAYFNIWCEAKAGWSVFMKRRTAVRKIESLPEASGAQLQELDDVCAICYQEMRSAKITRCRHFFHGVCLRKWLYMQDRCPLCHDILYWIDSAGENKDDEQANENLGEEARMDFDDELEIDNEVGN